MDCGLCVCARKVAKSMRVSSEAGMGKPLVLRWLYVSVKLLKLCWAEEYEERVEGAREWCR